MIGLLALAAAAGASPYQYVLSIDPRHRLVEGIATDGEAIFISSVLDRQVLRCTTACSLFATLPKGLHPMGMAWDAKRRRLWVAADCPDLPSVVKCSRGALLGYGATGRQRTRIAGGTGDFHPGDVSASSGGEVFASDSSSGVVYRLTATASVLTTIVPTGVGRSAQGTAYGPGNRVIIADYGRGIASIDLATGVRTVLKRQDGSLIRGIDGLVRCGSSWFGIFNAQQPSRVVELTINGETVADRTVIQGGPLYDPTQLAIRKGQLLVVADAGWPEASKGTPRTRPATIIEIPLQTSCD